MFPCGLTKPLDAEIILLAPRCLTRLHITADRPQSPAVDLRFRLRGRGAGALCSLMRFLVAAAFRPAALRFLVSAAAGVTLSV
jgi:hypothetical protein